MGERIVQILPASGMLFLLLTGGVAAQQPTQAQANAIRQSCRGDYQSLCASVPTGGAASLQCLQQHITTLSPPCHDAVAAAGNGAHPPATNPGNQAAAAPPPMSRRQEAALMRHACGNDFHSYCANVRMGGGRALGCLMQNESRLSPQCRGALAEVREMK